MNSFNAGLRKEELEIEIEKLITQLRERKGIFEGIFPQLEKPAYIQQVLRTLAGI